MSSHHIIREKQEPALVIADIDEFDPEHLGQILEWSPTVVVLKAAVEKVYSLGLKIDVLVTNERDNTYIQEHTKVITSKDKDGLSAAFEYLKEEQYSAVNVIIDKFDINFFSQYVHTIDLVLLNSSERAFAVKSGFSKWRSINEYIDLLSETSQLQTSGLRKISQSSFITEKDGFYKLSFSNDFIFIAERL